MRIIKESDWKVFRELRQIALERFCERVLEGVERIRTDDTKCFHERYLDIYQLTRESDKELAYMFDNPRRSAAIIQLASIEGKGLLTDEEFSKFSQETREVINNILGLQDS